MFHFYIKKKLSIGLSPAPASFPLVSQATVSGWRKSKSCEGIASLSRSRCVFVCIKASLSMLLLHSQISSALQKRLERGGTLLKEIPGNLFFFFNLFLFCFPSVCRVSLLPHGFFSLTVSSFAVDSGCFHAKWVVAIPQPPALQEAVRVGYEGIFVGVSADVCLCERGSELCSRSSGRRCLECKWSVSGQPLGFDCVITYFLDLLLFHSWAHQQQCVTMLVCLCMCKHLFY